MTEHNGQWMFTVDLNRGRLLRLTRTEFDRPHVEPVAEITNEWKQSEHGRPSPLAAKNAKTNAVPPDSDDDRRHHFAKEVARWIDQQQKRHSIDTLHLYAATRFRGELRKVMPGLLQRSVVEHDGDLTSMPNSELQRHNAVRELLGVDGTG